MKFHPKKCSQVENRNAYHVQGGTGGGWDVCYEIAQYTGSRFVKLDPNYYQGDNSYP